MQTFGTVHKSINRVQEEFNKYCVKIHIHTLLPKVSLLYDLTTVSVFFFQVDEVSNVGFHYG